MSDKIKSDGAEDVFITGNPQITFFKAVYRKHTNFAIEIVEQSASSQPGLDDSTVTYTIAKGNGQLLYRMWLDTYFTGPNYSGNVSDGSYINWTNNTGHAYIKECSFIIGGQTIDTHTGKWLDIYNELYDVNKTEHMGLNKHEAKNTYLRSNKEKLENLQVMVPLKFWFCNNPGLALPIIALHKHEVKLKLTLRSPKFLINHGSKNGVLSATPGNSSAAITTNPIVKLFTEVIHLDTDETRRFIQNRHEYLIETIKTSVEVFSGNVKLTDYSHPVKEIIWVFSDKQKESPVDSISVPLNTDAVFNKSSKANESKLSGTQQKNDYFNYMCGTLGTGAVSSSELTNSSGGGGDIYGLNKNSVGSVEWFNTCVLKLDNVERFAPQKAIYFRTTQHSQYRNYIPKKHIYAYSFAIDPHNYTPSGTTNFSTIDNANFVFTNHINNNSNDIQMNIFAISYNIFRIMGGMGSLIYSN